MATESKVALPEVDNRGPLKDALDHNRLSLSAISRGNYLGRHVMPSGVSELLSVGYWDAHQKQDWKLDWHQNEGIKIKCVTRGQVSFGIDSMTTTLRRGDICITRPWQPHHIGTPFVPASRLVWFIMDVKVCRPNQRWEWPEWFLFQSNELFRMTELLQHNEQAVWRATPELLKSFLTLEEITEMSADSMLETRLKLIINTLMLNLVDMMEAQHVEIDSYLSTTKRAVEVVLRRVEQEVYEPWTLDSIAELAGLGRTRFSYYCRLITGKSPLEYVNNCRVSMTKKLLCERPDMSVTDIAMEAGFCSSQYFSKVFREITGISPKQYRYDNNVKINTVQG